MEEKRKMESFLHYITQYLAVLNPDTGGFLIDQNGQYIKVPHHEIYYLEATGGHVSVVCKDPYNFYQKYSSSLTLSNAHLELRPDIFLKLHKSYVINIKNIYSCDKEGRGGNIYFDKAKIIPSVRFSEPFKDILIKAGLIT